MDLLDNDEEKYTLEQKGKDTGVAAGVFIIIGCIFAFISTLGFVLTLIMIQSRSGIDGVTAGKALGMYQTGAMLVFWSFVIGIFLHNRAFNKFEYRRPWLWWVVLIGGGMGLVCGLVRFSWLLIGMSIHLLIHAFNSRSRYFEEEEYIQ